MCGIYGVAAITAQVRYQPAQVQLMGDITIHRGPDDSGLHADPRAIIGMRRLSIIDVEGGHQPISNNDNTVFVVCNGEIYNFIELREQLRSQGYHFKTNSDTEVIVHLYQRHGLDFVKQLRGMFAFALWDSTAQRLVIGRDRLGVKPLYYALSSGNLIFASEMKSILALPGYSKSINADALTDYLMLGYVPSPSSMVEGIHKLPPASILVCEAGKTKLHTYWQLQTGIEQQSDADWEEEYRVQLQASVQNQMISDVPLGAFLSGGIDSSSVVACMAAHSDQPVRTFSIGFGEASGGQYYNELPFARQVAELFSTTHKEIIVEPHVVDLMPRLLWHMDEPIADTAFVTTYLVSEFARREVKVILSGVGGDELFGGYRRYLGDYYLKAVNWLPAPMRRGLLRHVVSRLPADRHSPLLNLSRYAKAVLESSELGFEQRYMGYVSVLAQDQVRNLLINPVAAGSGALQAAFDRFTTGDAVNRMMQVDLVTQMPDDLLMLTDKMSMAASLECRVPLLDERMIELSQRMPGRQKIRGRELKSIMKRALAPMLPAEILHRKKRGFGAPMGAWFKNELKPMLEYLLSKQSIEQRGLFKVDQVEQMINEHNTNRADRTDEIMSLLNLEIWARMYLDGRNHADVQDELKQVA